MPRLHVQDVGVRVEDVLLSQVPEPLEGGRGGGREQQEGLQESGGTTRRAATAGHDAGDCVEGGVGDWAGQRCLEPLLVTGEVFTPWRAGRLARARWERAAAGRLTRLLPAEGRTTYRVAVD